MRVIALLPFKDEEWILSTFLSSVTPVVDEIVALDDGSTDASRELIERAGGHVEPTASREGLVWADHATGGPSRIVAVWQQLLEIGRQRGGTHFVLLDADEALTTPCRVHLRAALESLEPGQKLAMQWLILWKHRDRYRDDDSVWKDLFKDFAFADMPGNGDEFAFLHQERTPGPRDEAAWARLPPERGAVLHYQFVPWWRSQVKQAWYRCAELIRAPDKAYDINLVYSHSLDAPGIETARVPPGWLDGIYVREGVEDCSPGWHLDAILAWFDQYGLEYFEPLQIWHVPQLRERFVDAVGREPRPVVRLGPARRVAKGIRDRFSAAAKSR